MGSYLRLYSQVSTIWFKLKVTRSHDRDHCLTIDPKRTAHDKVYLYLLERPQF